MWLVTQGAGQPGPDLLRSVPYAGSNGATTVYASNAAPAGTANATISCAENFDSTSAAGASTVQTYTFTQNITGPTSTLVVTPVDDGFTPPRFLISSNGGCGTEENGVNGIQFVNILVYDHNQISPRAVITGTSSDGLGNWTFMPITIPAGTTDWDVQVYCAASTSNDRSLYNYPTVEACGHAEAAGDLILNG